MPSGGHNRIEPTQELMDEICRLVSRTPIGLKQICKLNPHIPSDCTIYDWIRDDKAFADAFSRAKLEQTTAKFESMSDVLEEAKKDLITDEKGRTRIDPGAIQLAKLKIDTIKFEIGKLNQKKYGNIVTAEATTESDKIKVTIDLGDKSA